MFKFHSIIYLLLLLSSDLLALPKESCSPVFSGNISNSIIKLDCSKELLSTGAKLKLEELLNEQFKGNNEGECNPEFKGAIKATDISVICGYPISGIQELIDGFLIRFTELKLKLSELQLTDADTKVLQEKADKAIDGGDFDYAQSLIDQIIAAEEAVGLKALEQIETLRGVIKETQLETAQASLDAGEVMIKQDECEEALKYFKLADASIDTVNKNSANYIAKLPVDNSAIVEKLEKCKKAQSPLMWLFK